MSDDIQRWKSWDTRGGGYVDTRARHSQPAQTRKNIKSQMQKQEKHKKCREVKTKPNGK